MFIAALGGAVLSIFLLGILLILLARARRVSTILVSAPTPAAAKRVPDCTVPTDPATVMVLDASVTGGVFAALNVTVPRGVTLEIQSSLVLIADNLLNIDGTITLSRAVPQGREVDMTLVSRSGTVLIGTAGRVGGTSARAPAGLADVNNNPLLSRATAGAGNNGGFIRILAPQGTIDVQGRIKGFAGGSGGAATSTSTGVLLPAPLGGILIGGSAAAAGGQAGAGGDVLLCALDGIRVSGSVQAGAGGAGGPATATAAPREDALAIGGPGNNGGDVLIQALAPRMQVGNTGTLMAGPGGEGGTVMATGGVAGSSSAGDAEAEGGVGGAGGTVRFLQDPVVEPVGTVVARDGGNGGDATALGLAGALAPILFRGGGQGGDATAIGGDGGASGIVPAIPRPAGGTAQGSVLGGGLATGKGGDATATAGPGGPGRRRSGSFPNRRGGRSGTGRATGGTGKSGNPPTSGLSRSMRSTGLTGGVTPPAVSMGTP